MSDPYLGQIILFGGTFAPKGWAFCQGQLLPISVNAALFSLLGTTYGGNGQTTFALPDLRGRVAVGFGQGLGLSNYFLGQQSGQETVTLTTQQMPAHSHPASGTLTADGSPGATTNPANANIAQVATSTQRPVTLAPSFTTGTPAQPGTVAGLSVTVGVAGSSQPHNNLQPLLVLNYLIALQGIFPSRD